MKVEDLDFLRMLPTFMRDDPVIVESARKVEEHIKTLTDRLPAMSNHRGVDFMNESELDELAWEEDVDWYDSAADIEAKREMLRFAALIKAKRGTEYSVVEILKAHFGSGWVKEWFDYGGKPFYFKVFTSNPQVIQEQYDKSMAEVKLSKNARSVLDTVGFYWLSDTRELQISFDPKHHGFFEHLRCGIAFLPHKTRKGPKLEISSIPKSCYFRHPECAADLRFPKIRNESQLVWNHQAGLEISCQKRKLVRLAPFTWQKRIRNHEDI